MAADRTSQLVAFLRGINVGANGKGRKNVPMPELRGLAEEIGFGDPRTYVQSGNLVFAAGCKEAHAEQQLEAAIQQRFGFEVPVIVRSMQELVRTRKDCPFEDAVRERPKFVHVGWAKERIDSGALKALEPYCARGERVALSGQSFWVDYPEVRGSKLTPAVLNRTFGSPVTQRNAKTLDALVALASA